MTAPSKKTKAELQKELSKTKDELDDLRQLHDHIGSQNKRLVKENLEIAESRKKIRNHQKEDFDSLRKYQHRFGTLKDRQVIVRINSQTHYPKDFKAGNEFVRKLIDAGIWYFEVSEK